MKKILKSLREKINFQLWIVLAFVALFIFADQGAYAGPTLTPTKDVDNSGWGVESFNGGYSNGDYSNSYNVVPMDFGVMDYTSYSDNISYSSEAVPAGFYITNNADVGSGGMDNNYVFGLSAVDYIPTNYVSPYDGAGETAFITTNPYNEIQPQPVSLNQMNDLATQWLDPTLSDFNYTASESLPAVTGGIGVYISPSLLGSRLVPQGISQQYVMSEVSQAQPVIQDEPNFDCLIDMANSWLGSSQQQYVTPTLDVAIVENPATLDSAPLEPQFADFIPKTVIVDNPTAAVISHSVTTVEIDPASSKSSQFPYDFANMVDSWLGESAPAVNPVAGSYVALKPQLNENVATKIIGQQITSLPLKIGESTEKIPVGKLGNHGMIEGTFNTLGNLFGKKQDKTGYVTITNAGRGKYKLNLYNSDQKLLAQGPLGTHDWEKLYKVEGSSFGFSSPGLDKAIAGSIGADYVKDNRAYIDNKAYKLNTLGGGLGSGVLELIFHQEQRGRLMVDAGLRKHWLNPVEKGQNFLPLLSNNNDVGLK